MYKVLAITLLLTGCSSTTVPDIRTAGTPSTVSTNYNYSKHCFSIWDNTKQGYVERKICGNHIP